MRRTPDASDQGARRFRHGVALGCLVALVLSAWMFLPTSRALSQQGEPPSTKGEEPPSREKPSSPAGAVTVKPRADDDAIRERLERIMRATGKYKQTRVVVKDGVVFLEGQAKSERLKEWAAETAGKVEDVVAVFNSIEVQEPSPWDYQPALEGLESIWFDVVRSLPFVAFGIITMVLAWFAAIYTARLASLAFRSHLPNYLLRQVVARGLGLFVFLIGLYVVLQVAGLTRLAVTVLGGTGLLGLILGIAFRDITENFLASVFLSMQQPFSKGDLVDIGETRGFVQSLTYRVTIVMTLDGNHVQIPNSTVYKSTIRNLSSNPNMRQDFAIGIGYDTLIADAQAVALQVLADHPAVLTNPEPWVLVDGLGTTTVNLRVYFWLDVNNHSYLKVRSSVMRMIKRAFQDANISMPDEAREIIFPQGVPVRMVEKREPGGRPAKDTPSLTAGQPEAASTAAEGGLGSEADQISNQAQHANLPEGGTNLLPSQPAAP